MLPPHYRPSSCLHHLPFIHNNQYNRRSRASFLILVLYFRITSLFISFCSRSVPSRNPTTPSLSIDLEDKQHPRIRRELSRNKRPYSTSFPTSPLDPTPGHKLRPTSSQCVISLSKSTRLADAYTTSMPLTDVPHTADQITASSSEPFLLATLAAYTLVTLLSTHRSTPTLTRDTTAASPVPKATDEVSCLR